MFFPNNSGDPGHSGLSMGLSWRIVALARGVALVEAKILFFSNPTTNVYSGRKATSLIGQLRPPELRQNHICACLSRSGVEKEELHESLARLGYLSVSMHALASS